MARPKINTVIWAKTMKKANWVGNGVLWVANSSGIAEDGVFNTELQ